MAVRAQGNPKMPWDIALRRNGEGRLISHLMLLLLCIEAAAVLHPLETAVVPLFREALLEVKVAIK